MVSYGTSDGHDRESARPETGARVDAGRRMRGYRSPVLHNGEFSTCSNEITLLKELKEQLRSADFPLEATRAAVGRFLQPQSLVDLAATGRGNVYLPAPSTSGTNLLPAIMAAELQKRFGGRIEEAWAFPQNVTRTVLKAGIGRLRDPQRYDIADDIAQRVAGAARLILVDDMVSTGMTQRSLREGLLLRGVRISDVVSLAQSEMRKVTERDIARVTQLLGDPSLQTAIAGVLTGQLRHFSNYIERIFDRDPNERTAAEIRNYFTTEYARLQQLGFAHGRTELGIGDGARTTESAQRLVGPAADLSAGVSQEARSVRGSEDRAANQTIGVKGLGELMNGLEAQRAAWLSAPAAQQPQIVRAAEEMIMALGGSDVTRVPLKVAARQFVTGSADKKLLERRATDHLRLLLTHNAIPRSQDRSRGGRDA